jgi:putative DNA primase/helicase
MMNLDPLTNLRKDPDPDDISAALRTVVMSLNGADPLDQVALRQRGIAILEEHGVKSPAKYLDAALAVHHQAHANETESGSDLTLADPVPAANPVNGARLLTMLAETFTDYVALPKEAADTAALATVMAHTADAVDILPMIAITSPTKQCGKSTLLCVATGLAPRALWVNNATGPVLFRAIEKYRPTVFIDEGEAIGDDDALRQIINVSHIRSSAYVLRNEAVEDGYALRRYNVFCPKWIACIGRLRPGTAEDRSITIRMRRRTHGEKIRRLRQDRLMQILAPLQSAIARWAADHLDALRSADPAIDETVNDRVADNWRPLLAIADEAGGEWPSRARRAMKLLTGQVVEDQAIGLQLLADVAAAFQPDEDKLPTASLLSRLLALEERPWGEYRHGKALSANQLAELLRPFGIRSKTIREGDKTPKGYDRSDLADAIGRYLPSSEPQHPQQINGDAELGPKREPQQDPFVAPQKITVSPEEIRDVAGVAAENAVDRDIEGPEEPGADDLPF